MNSIKKDNHSLILSGNSNKSFKLTLMNDSAIDTIFGLLVLSCCSWDKPDSNNLNTCPI